MFIPKHFENLNVLHENTMENRAYYREQKKVYPSFLWNELR